MEVLLREDVDNLGQRGEVVRVRAGYGRNYLLPQGLAIKASAGNKKMIEDHRRALAKREEKEKRAAQGDASKLEGLELRFLRRVGESGTLYGSVTSFDVVEALKERGIEVERRRVGLHEHIKQVGDYSISIKLHRDVVVTVKVEVRGEGEPEVVAEAATEAAQPAPEADSAAQEQTTTDETAAGEAAAEE
jgi:large subunit ribosomal protein L9